LQPKRELTAILALKSLLPPLFLSLLFDIIAGSFLGVSFEKLMVSYPTILFILPALMGLRGNVFGSLGSRISTSLYLGSAEPSFSDKLVRNDILFSIWAATIPAFILLTVASLRFPEPELIIKTFYIILGSSVSISVILGILTAVIVIQSFKAGFDPDNLVGPAITTFADLVSIPSIILFILILEYLGSFEYLAALFICILLFSFYNTIKNRRGFKELLIIISILALLQCITGSLLQEYSEDIHASTILAFAYPAILGSVGNYGSIVVARTSTKLHLGEVTSFASRTVVLDIFYVFLVSVVIVPVIFLSSVLMSSFLGSKSKIDILAFVMFSSIYLLLTALILIFSAIISISLYRRGVNPDDGGIPLATTISDIFGTVAVVVLAKLLI